MISSCLSSNKISVFIETNFLLIKASSSQSSKFSTESLFISETSFKCLIYFFIIFSLGFFKSSSLTSCIFLYIFSKEPKCLIIGKALFSPNPLTPGIPEDGLPIKAL